MFPSRGTRLLLGLAVLLGLLLAIPSQRHAGQLDLPELPTIAADTVTRIQIVEAGQPIVIEREGERWFLRQPLQAEADAAAIRSLLKTFAKALPMDLRVDQGNLEDYALDDSNNLTFELFTGAPEPALAFTLGKDLAGGSSLVRLRDGDAVYRARVGGRHRYDREPTDWRNHALLDVDAAAVVGLILLREGGDLTFTREIAPAAEEGGEPAPGPWRFADDPDFVPDQRTLDGLVQGIALLRASELHAGDFGDGWDAPAQRCELALADGGVRRLTLVPGGDAQSALARVEGREDVFRISALWLERIGAPLSELRDKTIFSFSRDQVDSITLEEGEHKVRIQQDLGTKLWRVVEPVAMDADLRRTLYTVNALSDLRALSVSEGTEAAAAGLREPRSRFTVQMVDGSTHTLEIGDAFQAEGTEMVYAWADERLPIFELRAEAHVRLRQAFLKM